MNSLSVEQISEQSRKLNIPVTEFDKSVNELALKLFEKGYDVRFQTTQAIPVFINEMVVRLLYSIRRLIGYYISVPKKDRSYKPHYSNIWIMWQNRYAQVH